MEYTNIRQFLCDTIDKAVLRKEWEKWRRSVTLFLDAEDIVSPVKRRNKLLHLGGIQLQEVAYNTPGAIEEYDPESNNDVFGTLLEKLDVYFSPQQNSTFERHLFRQLKPEKGETLNKFLLRVRQQANKCSFGQSEKEATELNMKDKLIDCWAPVELKKKLLEKERSLEEVMDLCCIQEQIDNQAAVMVQKSEPGPSCSDINKVSYKAEVSNECTRCGRKGHKSYDPHCPGRKVTCHKCGRLGHFALKCRTKSKRPAINTSYQDRKRRKNSINFVDCNRSPENLTELDDNMKNFDCFQIEKQPGPTTDSDELINCMVGGVHITMLIDSGSRVNVITGKDWDLLNQKKATTWNVNRGAENTLKPYASENLKVKHVFESTITVEGRSEIIATFYVIPNGDVSLVGRDTAKHLKILKLGLSVNIIGTGDSSFPKVKDIRVKLSIDPSVKPVQQPLRRIPVSLEDQVDHKLQEGLRSDIIEKVEGPSEWVSPIVIIFKPDGDIRICVDMRRANEAIKRENYPLPTFDSLMTKVRNARYFSRLDLKNAYHQLELDEASRPITTFITHRGMFRYKRLMFGVNSAPEIFQRIFEGMLAHCPNSLNYLDDIITFGSSEEDHDKSLKKALDVLKERGVMLNENKCRYKVQTLKFLGHQLSASGINAGSDKVETILNFRAPATKEEVRSFLGLVTYLGKFIPDLGTVTELLRNLTKQDVKFNWSTRHQSCFDRLKTSLAKLPTLAYFDPEKRTRLIADASPIALGAVLIQFDKDDTPNVISFASKSLSDVEKRYSQTEKESLALVWAVERFYYYLSGLCFELVTDHKPLEAIFKPSSKPPARIERWVLRLQSFKFRVIYEPGKSNIADSVSRLCKTEPTTSFDNEGEYHIRSLIENKVPKAVTISQIFNESRKDSLLQEAATKVLEGSWESNDKNPYSPFRWELTKIGPVLLRGSKIVVPETLRSRILNLAHEGHPGETVMKRRLRSKVWWPLIDRDAEKYVKNCQDCILVSRPNKPPPMARHRFPEGPWQVIALDLMKAGPIPEEILGIIDYHSRYQEIKFLKSTTSSKIIQVLEEMFARLGIPKTIRADNGAQFASEEFRTFCENQGIELVSTIPYWPQANGEIENLNKQILKRLQISFAANRDHKKELQEFTMMYNVTPHGTTGKTPAELLYGRNIRDKIPSLTDLLSEPSCEEARDNDLMNKEKGKRREDENRGSTNVNNNFQVGDKVLVKNVVFPHKLTTSFGKKVYEIIEKLGSEAILEAEGRFIRRHLSHLKKVTSTGNVESNSTVPRTVAKASNLNSSSSTSNGQTSDLPTPAPAQPKENHQQAFQHRGEDTNGPEAPSRSDTPTRVEPLRLKREEGMWRPVL